MLHNTNKRRCVTSLDQRIQQQTFHEKACTDHSNQDSEHKFSLLCGRFTVSQYKVQPQPLVFFN